jgi:hypothetical protein
MTSLYPNQGFSGDVAQFEVCRAASLHQAEGDRKAIVGDVNDLVSVGYVFAPDEIAAWGARAQKSSRG